jgi:hypothetical protein
VAVKKESRPRVFRHQNIIGDKIYKEQTAKGGIRWFIGEDIDREKLKENGVEIDPEAERVIELAKKVATKINDSTEIPKKDEKKNQRKKSVKKK